MSHKLYFVKFSYTAVAASKKEPDANTITSIEDDVLMINLGNLEASTEIENMDQLQRLAPDVDPDEPPYGDGIDRSKTIRDYLERQ